MIESPTIVLSQALLWQALKHCQIAYASGNLSFDEYQTLEKCILNVDIRNQ